jgi:hypothetical protein
MAYGAGLRAGKFSCEGAASCCSIQSRACIRAVAASGALTWPKLEFSEAAVVVGVLFGSAGVGRVSCCCTYSPGFGSQTAQSILHSKEWNDRHNSPVATAVFPMRLLPWPCCIMVLCCDACVI